LPADAAWPAAQAASASSKRSALVPLNFKKWVDDSHLDPLYICH
jgi:hypothetical protein